MRVARLDSPTKEKLLSAAAPLMLAQGFTATSVDEICEAAGVTKGSFFHYFDSKEELATVLLGRFYEMKRQELLNAPFMQLTDPLERVYGYIDFLIEVAGTPEDVEGCLLGTFSQELSDTHPKIRDVCAEFFKQWALALKQELDKAKTKYAPRARWDTQSLAEHLIAVLEGAIILAKAKQDQQVVKTHLRHFRDYLRGIFGK